MPRSAVASRDAEIRQVTARLEALMDALDANVTALAAILAPPEAAATGKEPVA
jgi:hypothetical protein